MFYFTEMQHLMWLMDFILCDIFLDRKKNIIIIKRNGCCVWKWFWLCSSLTYTCTIMDQWRKLNLRPYLIYTLNTGDPAPSTFFFFSSPYIYCELLYVTHISIGQPTVNIKHKYINVNIQEKLIRFLICFFYRQNWFSFR